MTTSPTTGGRRRLVLAVLVSITALLALTARGSNPAAAATKSFELLELVTTAEVRPDGSMAVSEDITYRFEGGPFTVGTRSFLADDRDRISSFTASENGVFLPIDPPSATPTGEWEWRFSDPVTDSTRTYRLEYVVPRAVTVGSDVGELYWQFLGVDHPGVGAVEVSVTLPGQFPVAVEATPPDDISVVRAWGHGPRQGVVDVSASTITLSVADVPAGEFVEARVALPADAFVADATSGPRLETILAEEGVAIDRTLADDRGRSYEPPPSALARLLGPLGALVGLVGAAGLWARFGREPRPDPMIGEYWREPIHDPPAVALANLAKGGVDLGRSFGSTLIDLAQRGHLTIREEQIERFGPDRVERHLTRTDRDPADRDDLESFERRLLSFVFRDGSPTTIDEVAARAKRDSTEAQAFAKGFSAEIGEVYRARGYQQEHNPGRRWIVVLTVVVAVLGGVAFLLGSALGFVAIAGAVAAAVIAAIGLSNRTRLGADEAARTEGLRRFLRDFSNLADAPAGHLVLWERFLVYAVALGVAGELLHGLEARLPAMLNDPAFGAWYAGYGIRRFDSIDRFPSDVGGVAAAAVAPSKSGSGGGFSGGGGFGGGGGGFGAR